MWKISDNPEGNIIGVCSLSPPYGSLASYPNYVTVHLCTHSVVFPLYAIHLMYPFLLSLSYSLYLIIVRHRYKNMSKVNSFKTLFQLFLGQPSPLFCKNSSLYKSCFTLTLNRLDQSVLIPTFLYGTTPNLIWKTDYNSILIYQNINTGLPTSLFAFFGFQITAEKPWSNDAW